MSCSVKGPSKDPCSFSRKLLPIPIIFFKFSLEPVSQLSIAWQQALSNILSKPKVFTVFWIQGFLSFGEGKNGLGFSSSLSFALPFGYNFLVL